MNLVFLLTAWLIVFPLPSFAQTCEVVGIYEVVEPPPGTIGITSMGMLEELSALLVPSSPDAGNYEVTVTHKASDLYEIIGSNMLIRTQYCFEFVYYQEAILQLTYNGTGRLIFIE